MRTPQNIFFFSPPINLKLYSPRQSHCWFALWQAFRSLIMQVSMPYGSPWIFWLNKFQFWFITCIWFILGIFLHSPENTLSYSFREWLNAPNCALSNWNPGQRIYWNSSSVSGPQLLFLPLREGISHLQSSAPTPQVLLLEPNWSSWAFSLSQSTTCLVPPFLICLLHVPILPWNRIVA